MDIDIDLKDNFDPTEFFNVTLASMVNNKDELVKHPAGAYFQNIPIDSFTGLSAIPYKVAEKIGYTKIDFLHIKILDHFSSKKQIRILANTEPDWNLLKSKQNVEKLFQIKNHFDIVNKIKPTSIIELSDCIAIIRPGKRKLLNEYLKNPNKIRTLLYLKQEDSSYMFKKSHSVAYATTIVLQLHLIKKGIL